MGWLLLAALGIIWVAFLLPTGRTRFVGTAERKRARARDRRRQVFTFLLESIGITFLIGLVPPLRVLWTATASLGVLLAMYTWLLLAMKHQHPQAHPHDQARAAHQPPSSRHTVRLSTRRSGIERKLASTTSPTPMRAP